MITVTHSHIADMDTLKLQNYQDTSHYKIHMNYECFHHYCDTCFDHTDHTSTTRFPSQSAHAQPYSVNSKEPSNKPRKELSIPCTMLVLRYYFLCHCSFSRAVFFRNLCHRFSGPKCPLPPVPSRASLEGKPYTS